VLVSNGYSLRFSEETYHVQAQDRRRDRLDARTPLRRQAAQWIAEIAKARGDFDVEIVDLRDYPLPFFDESPRRTGCRRRTRSPRSWQKKVAELDGFIFTAAEYNRGSDRRAEERARLRL
jgi:hypothetical protein